MRLTSSQIPSPRGESSGPVTQRRRLESDGDPYSNPDWNNLYSLEKELG